MIIINKISKKNNYLKNFIHLKKLFKKKNVYEK